MRLFAAVVKTGSFTAAARSLAIPKQTLSRRIGAFEQSLGVQLIQRTTRRMQATDIGAAFAERCADIVRQADEAMREITDTHEHPQGTLRITADPVFGEAFVTELVIEYSKLYPDVELDVVLTQRHVDLVAEGFDVAFRVGHEERAGLTATSLMRARVRYCASPDYLASHDLPRTPEDLANHECILVLSEGTSLQWPFRSATGMKLVRVSGHYRFTNFAMAHQAVLAGLGVGIFPEFKCESDIASKRLVPVLGDSLLDVGTVSIVHVTQRFLAPRIRRFIELANKQFD